ncbi:MAG: hypothetical protein R2825_02910 [Saprospiraceae bacterium]
MKRPRVAPYTLDVMPNNSTVITLMNVTDANGCTSAITNNNTATVNVNLPPQVVLSSVNEDCNALETEFTVSFNITGGDAASYTVNPTGGTITGNAYTSAPFPTNSFYSFEIDDANGCGPTLLEGGHACDCLTQAGTMQQGALTLCGTEMTPANIYDASTQVLDPDDVSLFVLLSNISAMPSPADIVGVNPIAPVFGFNMATMQYGTPYFIVAVVGNSDGMGGIDFINDLCLSISNPISVTFYPLPTVTIAGPAAICEGGLADIEFTVTGNSPFDISYLLNGTPTSTGPTNATSTIPLPVPLPATSTITLVSIQDL